MNKVPPARPRENRARGRGRRVSERGGPHQGHRLRTRWLMEVTTLGTQRNPRSLHLGSELGLQYAEVKENTF